MRLKKAYLERYNRLFTEQEGEEMYEEEQEVIFPSTSQAQATYMFLTQPSLQPTKYKGSQPQVHEPKPKQKSRAWKTSTI